MFSGISCRHRVFVLAGHFIVWFLRLFSLCNCSVGDMTQSSTSTTNGGPFTTAGTLTVDDSIVGDAEGNPVVNPSNVTGTVTDPGPTRTMPLPSVRWPMIDGFRAGLFYAARTGAFSASSGER